MTRHVDAEALGQFSAGDLSQRQAARVGAHLARCSRCADLSQQLAGVTALLASTQVPPMPEYLAVRIQNSLAAESARRTALDPGTEPGRRELPGRQARRGRRGFASPFALRALAAAGAVAVIAGGSYLILQPHRPASPAGASSAAGGRARSATAGQAPNAAPAPGRVTSGPALHYSSDGHAGSFVPVSSQANFGPASLAAQVSSTLTQLHSSSGQSPESGSAPSETNGQNSPAAGISALPGSPAAARAGRFGGIPVGVLEGCVARIAADRPVLLVDIARYLGGPATLVVVGGTGPAADHLWVVGPACSATASDVLAQRDLPRG